MRILLVAEGQHELGAADAEGALQCLVRRLLPAHTTLSQIVTCKLSDPEIGHVSGRGDRLTKRILFAMRLAMERGCDALVLLLDEDGDRARRKSVDTAQESPLFPIQRAIGIAIQAFDAWMLADETAISKALEKTTATQRKPEDLTRPKDHFAQLHQDAGCTLPFHEAYARIAENARLETLVARCPDGFAPFAKRVAALHD